MQSVPELAEHLEAMQQAREQVKDALPVKMRRAFLLLVFIARLRRSKDAAETLPAWGLTTYLIALRLEDHRGRPAAGSSRSAYLMMRRGGFCGISQIS